MLNFNSLKVNDISVAEETKPQEVVEKNPEIVGTYQHKLAFVSPLGDPAHPDVSSKGTLPRIVGYRFKVLEDTIVPDFGTTSAFSRQNLMDVGDVTKFKKVKAGDIVDLTKYETGWLLCQEAYAGKITGGEYPVDFMSINPTKDTKAGILLETTNRRPTISLRLANGGSLKELRSIVIMEQTGMITRNGVEKPLYTIKPEFAEKFGPLASAPKKKNKVVSKQEKSADEALKLKARNYRAIIEKLDSAPRLEDVKL